MFFKSNGRKVSLTIIAMLIVAAILAACGDATNTAGSAASTTAATSATTAAMTSAAATTAAMTSAAPAATTAAMTSAAPAATTAAMTSAAPAATTAAMTSAAATTAATSATTAAMTSSAAMTTAATGTGGAGALPTGITGSSLNANLNGSGSTLVSPALKVWQTGFGAVAPGAKINYPGGGSGQGRSDFLTGKVDFGGSDVQISADEFTKNNKQATSVIQIPWTLAGVVLTYNLTGVTDMNLSPATIGDIFTGKITSWNDAKIKADNPSANLPNLPIKFAVRADSSGTSQVFTSYLSAVSPDFKTAVGASSQPKWEGAGLNVTTAPGNDGVAGLVKGSEGTLGYNEVAYAIQNKLSYAGVKNAAGKFVKPTLENLQAAAASAKPDDNLKIDLINQAGDNAYPITTTTYVLINKDYADKAKAQALVAFVWYALHQGGEEAKSANYAPLPDAIVKLAEAKLKTVTAGGSPVIQ